MPTATKPAAGARPAPAAKKSGGGKSPLPEFAGLAIDVPFEIEDEAAAKLQAYHADCSDFARKAADLFQSREKLLADAMDNTLRDLLASGASLGSQKLNLERVLAALRWQRFELLPQLEPEFVRAVADATAQHERTIEAEMQRFRESGADESSMPAGGHNPTAAGRQFRHRIMQEPTCMAALGLVNRMQSALRVVRSQLNLVPGIEQCEIIWPIISDSATADIARWAGIA